jgi:hypothetical protein
VLIDEQAGSTIDISGPRTITGDLIVLNNGVITSLTSSSLASVSGEFHMQNLTLLSTLSMLALESVGSISWTSLPALGQLTFGTPGVTTADSVTISDTFLSALTGIDLETVASMDINNNRRLTDFTTQLGNVSTIAEMTISNVTSFLTPSLAVVNGSARFDSNYFTSLSAPNLTSTKTGDISFVGNANLNNISYPELTSIGGGLLIANNTELQKINDFGSLKEVGGAVKLRGNFTEYVADTSPQPLV